MALQPAPGALVGHRGWVVLAPDVFPLELCSQGHHVLCPGRIANSNNMNKSESDQEDNDDINDNDWSYGSEKKGV